MPTSCPISIAESISEAEATHIAHEYGLALASSPDAPYLAVTETGLTLFIQSEKNALQFCPDLGFENALQRQEEGKTLLVNALGKRQLGETIIDATAGLLRDALTLRLSGFEVIALERSPILYALMHEALKRAKDHPALRLALSKGFNFIHTDAKDFFSATKNNTPAAVIYLDPMFEESKKTAAVKAPMQALRALLQHEDAPETLLEAALDSPVKRVVVKRHKNAPVLVAKPSQQLAGKSIRFDVYQR